MHEKSKYRLPRPGDLADVRRLKYGATGDEPNSVYRGALVLSYSPSNVYESASCEVYYGGSIFWVETKYLTLCPGDSVD